MTNKEAIRIIKIVLAIAEDFEITVQGEELTEEKCKEAVEIVTKALEQQPCKDCISREQAVYVASGYCEPQNIADELRKLPSVTPQPKRGKWEDIGMWLEGRKYGKDHGEMIDAYSCDYCGYSQYHKTNFCPNCGADMREVQDANNS